MPTRDPGGQCPSSFTSMASGFPTDQPEQEERKEEISCG